MKKSIFLVLAIGLLSTTSFAQKKKSSNGGKGGGAYEKGELTLSVGLTASSNRAVIMGGPSIMLDYGLTQDLSLGGYLGTYFGGYRDYWRKNSYADILVGPRVAFHFGRILHMPSSMDWYAGSSIGFIYSHHSYKEYYYENNWNNKGKYGSRYGSYASVYANVFTGFRYYVKPKFALYAEAGGGYNSAYFQLGVAFKF